MGARLPYALEVEPPLKRAMYPHSPGRFQLLSGGSPALSRSTHPYTVHHARNATPTSYYTTSELLRPWTSGPNRIVQRPQTTSAQHGVDHHLQTPPARPHPVTSKGTTRRLDHGPKCSTITATTTTGTTATAPARPSRRVLKRRYPHQPPSLSSAAASSFISRRSSCSRWCAAFALLADARCAPETTPSLREPLGGQV